METLAIEANRFGRTETSFTILMLDVDHFKKFNDTHGHLAGDEALKAVSAVLKQATRDIDCVSRFGGEEFLVVLPETGLDGAGTVAERIRQQLAEDRISVGEQSVTVTLSIGVAEFPIDGDSSETLIASADAALYQAKRGGRDRVMIALRPDKTLKARPTKTAKDRKDTS